MNETKSLFPGMQILGGAGNKQNIKSESATQKIKLHVGMKSDRGENKRVELSHFMIFKL